MTSTELRTTKSWIVIIRCIWCRGTEQAEALAELDRRRLWLTEDQRTQAVLS